MIHKNLLEAITQQYYTDNYYCLHINRNTNNFFELKVFRDCMSQSQLLLLDSCTLKLPYSAEKLRTPNMVQPHAEQSQL